MNNYERIKQMSIEEMAERLNKLKQALEEIREIAMGIMDNDVEETSSYYDANLIINKIDEVLK